MSQEAASRISHFVCDLLNCAQLDLFWGLLCMETNSRYSVGRGTHHRYITRLRRAEVRDDECFDSDAHFQTLWFGNKWQENAVLSVKIGAEYLSKNKQTKKTGKRRRERTVRVFREGKSNWKKKKKIRVNRAVDNSFVRPVNRDGYIGAKLEQGCSEKERRMEMKIEEKWWNGDNQLIKKQTKSDWYD